MKSGMTDSSSHNPAAFNRPIAPILRVRQNARFAMSERLRERGEPLLAHTFPAKSVLPTPEQSARRVRSDSFERE
jgi:hypothetical protein